MTTFRTRRLRALAVATAALFGASLFSPAAADHGPLPPEGVDIPCDYTSDDVPEGVIIVLCILIQLDGGDAQVGNVASDFEGPIVAGIDAGITGAFEIVLLDGDGGDGGGNGGGGAPSLDFPPIEVPGGILGALGLDLGEPLTQLIDPINGVQAEVQAGDLEVGEVDLAAFLTGSGVLTTLGVPLTVQIQNLLLGNQCRIGSDEEPIDINLELALNDGYHDVDGLAWAQLTAADETFEIPAARNCGLLGTGGLLNALGLGQLNVFDQLVNDAVGLPSPSGENHIAFDGWLGFTAVNL